MKYPNIIEMEIRGQYAMFADPLISVGGEKLSYPIPTREALKGILRSVYWKPDILWYPDELRVMNAISFVNIGVRSTRYSKEECAINLHTVLHDVRYRLRAHFEFNENRTSQRSESAEHEHYFRARRMLKRGGTLTPFLGEKRYPAEVVPCRFDEGAGYYDSDGERDFGLMYCGMVYPDEGWDDLTRSGLCVSAFRAVMCGGVVRYPRPEQCENRFVKPMKPKEFAGRAAVELV